MRTLRVIAPLVVILAYPNHVLGQDTTSTQRSEPSLRQIDGVQSPAQIPDEVVFVPILSALAGLMEHQPQGFVAAVRQIGLSSADAQILRRELSAFGDEVRDIDRQLKEIIDARTSEPLENKMIRARTVRSEAQSRITARWSTLIAGLSESGAHAMREHLAREKKNVRLFVPPANASLAGEPPMNGAGR